MTGRIGDPILLRRGRNIIAVAAYIEPVYTVKASLYYYTRYSKGVPVIRKIIHTGAGKGKVARVSWLIVLRKHSADAVNIIVTLRALRAHGFSLVIHGIGKEVELTLFHV